MKKIAVILTNNNHYGDSNEPTGLWLAEAAEFVTRVEAAGLSVDYISPQGGAVPLDPRSLKRIYTSPSTLQYWHSKDVQHRALTHSLAATQVEAQDYAAIYFTGGHGVVWDFPNSQSLQQLTYNIYQQGGFVTSVCHGLAGLLNVCNSDGSYLIAGKRITGFTVEEEILSGKYKKMPFITETEARARGSKFTKRLPFTPYAVQDGQLITSQNPVSGGKVAELLLKNMQ